MKEKEWESGLGEDARNVIGDIYEGLPVDEPNVKFFYISPNQLKGFSRHSRNIIYFQKDTTNKFTIYKDLYSKPQLFFLIQGEDEDILSNYLLENKSLIINTIKDGERREKIRRMRKSLSNSNVLSERIGIKLVYPSIYKTVKDTLILLVRKTNIKRHIEYYFLPIA